ncbi:MAG: hypothetical protein NTY38_14515 [Acidobacteria bacterium]|nr:hypothetical protein [Acidobacteriota bacterium]
MILVLALLLTVLVIAFTLFVRKSDLPEPETVSPVAHLEERRARIYENLRDLQFEFRVGKLSDQDYQQSKVGLQQELAGVMAEIEKLQGPVVPKAPPAPPPGTVCPHCKAKFPQPLKFCGECGKPMTEGGAA